jgi:hypothetical protein
VVGYRAPFFVDENAPTIRHRTQIEEELNDLGANRRGTRKGERSEDSENNKY